MFRYKLRTLLIVLAIGLVPAIAVWLGVAVSEWGQRLDWFVIWYLSMVVLSVGIPALLIAGFTYLLVYSIDCALRKRN